MTHGQRMLQFATAGAATVSLPAVTATPADTLALPELMYGWQCRLARGESLDHASLRTRLESFGEGDELDLLSLSCFARCWSWLPDPPVRRAIFRRLESFRAGDGGYHATPGSPRGTMSALFMAGSAYQDLGGLPPAPFRLLGSVDALARPDGSYAESAADPVGSTTATAGAVLLRQAVFMPPAAITLNWLRARLTPEGGFSATPTTTTPDLASTAAALYLFATLPQRLPPTAIESTRDYLRRMEPVVGGDGEQGFLVLLCRGCLAA